MKRLSQTLLSLTVLVIIISSCTSCKKETPAPPPPTPVDTQAPTVPSGLTGTATATAVSLTWNASTDNVAVTGYKIYRAGSQIATSASTNYTDNGLTASTLYSYTVSSYDAAGNNSAQSSAFSISTSAPALTAVFTAVDASLSATLKSLPGNSVAKAFVLNVTTAGTAKLETIGTLTNTNNAIGFYWITSRDSSELFQSTSTFNPILAKTVASATQIINLSLGKNVICFKTALLNGAVTNGASVGLKLTWASGTISNASYTADAVSENLAAVVKINHYPSNNSYIGGNTQTTGGQYARFFLYPYSDQNGSISDTTLFPSMTSISYDSKNLSWFTGNFTGYSNLDFTNASGPAGTSHDVFQNTKSFGVLRVFGTSQASFVSGVLSFSGPAVKLLRTDLNSRAFVAVYAYVWNPNMFDIGPFNGCWYFKSVGFLGNPELWINAPGADINAQGPRIW